MRWPDSEVSAAVQPGKVTKDGAEWTVRAGLAADRAALSSAVRQLDQCMQAFLDRLG